MADQFDTEKPSNMADQFDTEKPSSIDRVEDVGSGQGMLVQDEKALIRRLDIRLVSATGLAYSISLMDRGNVPMAAIGGYVKSFPITHNVSAYIKQK